VYVDSLEEGEYVRVAATLDWTWPESRTLVLCTNRNKFIEVFLEVDPTFGVKPVQAKLLVDIPQEEDVVAIHVDRFDCILVHCASHSFYFLTRASPPENHHLLFGKLKFFMFRASRVEQVHQD